ncbi:helix-turn-helix domain-containing protein [Streptomyces sp. B15]|uniref:helix-turn-helix domain-containing protein n=1 Tax=Streptomyces sp. B15 TaxID=1537797 RepID=UPI001B37A652|nr:helix-turn-helix domain-containing protein [Streptomyces sp. B15]MBQ1122896.1 helix-turn-helix domain-containing protein [Streptomyces sp. B15]
MSGQPGPGRTEGELDPEAGAVPRFAAELRALRESAGKPTYRVMAQRARYGVTTLSQAAAGKQLPTRAVMLAYVKACGGDVIEWERRWREASAESAAEATDDGTARPPYRGLTRFEPGDVELFFGRDQLLDQLAELNRKHRFTAEADSVRETRAGLAARLDVAAYRMRSTAELRTRLASDAGRALATRLPGHGGVGSSVAYAPDGRTLASGGHDGKVRLWDTAARSGAAGGPRDMGRPLGEPLRLGTGTVGAVAFAPSDSDLLVATGEGGAIRFWNVRDRERPRAVGRKLVSHGEENIVSVAFAPDGRTLATTGDDGTVRLWDLSDPAHAAPLGEPAEADGSKKGSARAVAFAPDGDTLVTAGFDGTVRNWWFSQDDGIEPLGKPLREHTASVWTLAFSPDGDTLATAGFDDTVRLWDVSSPARPEPLGEPLDAHEGGAFAVAFSPDGRRLATGGGDDTVRLWDVRATHRVRPTGTRLRGHKDTVTSLAFAPDSRTLATGSEDHTARLWHVGHRTRARSAGAALTGHDHTVNAVAFAPDGKTLATAAGDRTVRLWDVRRAGRARPVVKELAGHRGPVRSVAFAPDGKTLATGGSDHTVRLWNVTDPARAEPVGRPLTGHVDTVTSVAFSPDGDALASAGYDLTARVWTLEADRAADYVCDRTEGVLTRAEWKEHLPELGYRETCEKR